MNTQDRVNKRINLIFDKMRFSSIKVDNSNTCEVLFNNLCLFLLGIEEVKNDLKVENIEIENNLIKDVRGIFTNQIIDKYKHLLKPFLKSELLELEQMESNGFKGFTPYDISRYQLYFDCVKKELDKENDEAKEVFNFAKFIKMLQKLSKRYYFYKQEKEYIKEPKAKTSFQAKFMQENANLFEEIEKNLPLFDEFIYNNSIDENKRRLPDLQEWKLLFSELAKSEKRIVNGATFGSVLSYRLETILQMFDDTISHISKSTPPPKKEAETFIDCLKNVDNKKEFAEALKNEFTDLRGKKEAAFVYALSDNNIIKTIPLIQLHKLLKNHFNSIKNKQSTGLSKYINTDYSIKNEAISDITTDYSERIGRLRKNNLA